MSVTKLYNGQVTLTFEEAGHCYRWVERDPPVGRPVRAQSKILGLLDKPAIGPWMVKSTSEYILQKLKECMIDDDPITGINQIKLPLQDAEKICLDGKTASRRISDAAKDIGTLVHLYAKKVLSGECEGIEVISLVDDANVRSGISAFLGWLKSYDVRPILVERPLLSRIWYYACTPDMYGLVNGKRSVVDFKTSSGFFLEMPLQLAANAIALEEEFQEEIKDGWIIRLDKKTGAFEPIHVPLDDYIKDAFLRLAEAEEKITQLRENLDAIRRKTTKSVERV